MTIDPKLVCDIKARPLDYPLSDYHRAISEGPLHFTWTDKPHRLVYDLIAAVKHYGAQQAAAAKEVQAQPVDWQDMYQKEKRRSEMWIAKYEKDIGPLEKAHPVARTPLTEDLAMMVRRLVLAIRRLAEDDTKDLTFANACLDWLKHKGLAGSPLREAAIPDHTALLRQALEAFEKLDKIDGTPDAELCYETIDTIRTALGEQV